MWRVGVVLFACLLCSGGLSGQEPVGQGGEQTVQLPYRVTGTDVPRYYVIRNFFKIAGAMARAGHGAHDILIMRLGIDPGTNAEQALIRALDRASELENGLAGPKVEERIVEHSLGERTVEATQRIEYDHYSGPSPVGKDEQTFMAQLREHETRKARALADIWVDLSLDLEQSGVSIGKIEDFVKTEIAPTTTMASDKPIETPDGLSIAFESQVARRGGGR